MYDRRLLKSSSSSPPFPIRTVKLPPSTPEPPPSLSSKDVTLQEWQELFGRRRRWAFEVADVVTKTIKDIKGLDHERDIIYRGAAIAVSNMSQHTVNLKPKFEQTHRWADQILEDQHYLLENWQGSTAYYGAIPAIAELARCIRTGSDSVAPSRNPRLVYLADLVDPSKLKDFGKHGQQKHQQFSNQIADLTNTFEDVVTNTNKILEDLQASTSISSDEISDRTEQILQEIEVLSQKMHADCSNIQALSDSPKSLTQAQRTAYLHDNTFVTSLVQTSEETLALLSQISLLRSDVPNAALQLLQQVSQVESNISTLHQKLAQLDVDQDSSRVFKFLNAIVRLPFIYGSLLIECIRRHEWTKHMDSESNAATENTAAYRSVETARRQKWAKDIGAAVDLSSLSVTPSRDAWPNATRDDLRTFLSSLEKVGFRDILSELKEMSKELDVSLAQQPRRNKAFKNGSLHEATLGETSMLLRGDNKAIENLRKDKTRSEEKLRSAESRIRKLEDLLHRQSQSSRNASLPGIGISATPSFERHVTSPGPFSSALSRAREAEPIPSSLSSRRTSFNQEHESKNLAQRVVILEAELMAQRTHSKDLERASAARSNAEAMLKEQIREAISTKEDLLSNFEAQQREFDDERRLSNEENKKLRVRLEEIEDELERVYASRDREFRIQSLEHDLDTTKQEADMEIRKAHEQAESARNEYRLEKDLSHQLQQSLQKLQRSYDQLESMARENSQKVEERDKAEKYQQDILLSALLRISQDIDVPDDFETLIQTLSKAVGGAMSYQMDLAQEISNMKAELGGLEDGLQSKEDKLTELQKQLDSKDDEADRLQAQVAGHAARQSLLEQEAASLRAEKESVKNSLEAEQAAVANLRSYIVGKDQTIKETAAKLGSAHDEMVNLTSKLEEKRSELSSLQGSYVRLQSHRDLQAKRADDISGRLYLQNSKLQRLLEQLNFNISRQDGKMMVQRISSKSAGGSAILGDPAASMKRSTSGQLLGKEEAESVIDPKVLHWATSGDGEDASLLHEGFVQIISTFNTDVFHEAIYKRMKEVEHIARKSQRDARAYREKAHRAQAEAHERIALRGFKEGDLALFLPTKDQATKPWAAFNVGAPHYFLREQDSHKLSKRDWMIARISKVEQRVVDLSKSINSVGASTEEERVSIDDENPYELSDGLRWYLLDAAEEKPGAPISIGSGKTTVAAVNVEAATGTVRLKKSLDGSGATKTLTRSLDSRRSSTNSRKGLPATIAAGTASTASANTTPTELAEAGKVGEGHAIERVLASTPSAEGTGAVENVGHTKPPDFPCETVRLPQDLPINSS